MSANSKFATSNHRLRIKSQIAMIRMVDSTGKVSESNFKDFRDLKQLGLGIYLLNLLIGFSSLFLFYFNVEGTTFKTLVHNRELQEAAVQNKAGRRATVLVDIAVDLRLTTMVLRESKVKHLSGRGRKYGGLCNLLFDFTANPETCVVTISIDKFHHSNETYKLCPLRFS
ncbi:hypothetical protein VNO78_08688 [Psophocarpus tetragonolobus]|uniref:Uncharacterized protein n=1 Tax=Psophocarpus tetragonolobus TaxID=3891 RepID=A0AAN9XT70_PSOTE